MRSEMMMVRSVSGFPKYCATADGLVVSHWKRRPKTLRRFSDRDGYLRVSLYVAPKEFKTMRVHEVVCTAFHGPKPSPDHEVAHANGDKADNRPGNLRWATRLENMADQREHGRSPVGARNGRAKLDEAKVRAIRAKYSRGGFSQKALAHEYGVSRALVHYVVSGERWAHVSRGAE